MTAVPAFEVRTEFGTVGVRLSAANWAYCEVGALDARAYVNDSRPAFTYRGQEYVGRVRLRLVAAGWEVADASFTKRPQWSDAPRTYRAAMAEAVRAAVAKRLDGCGLVQQAAVAEAEREFEAALRACETAQAALTEASRLMDAAASRLNDLQRRD